MDTSRLPRVDTDALARDLDALRSELRSSSGPEDLAHLRKIEAIGRLSTLAGWALCLLPLSPLWLVVPAAILLSTGRFARWTMVGHHVLHRGYDGVPGVPETRKAGVFARGRRRVVDWLDWLLPEAWDHEHNRLHHYRLNEAEDPDLVERNLAWLRDSPRPVIVKWAIVAFFVLTWRFTYYAPNTLKELRARNPSEVSFARDLWLRCYLPYGAVHFVLIPALFLPFGMTTAATALAASLLGEALVNVHTFCVIVPNHAGEDLVRFDGPGKGKGTFYLRQILGSANFRTGGDANDFLHGWLNYQIEHHLFPDVSMLALRRARPRVREICERHGVPYVQESVFLRVRKTIAVMVGTATMLRG